MGLDMFLMKYPRNKNITPEQAYNKSTEIGYWRKANEVHKWFVDNCQNGVDDCGCYQVDKSDIENLLEICNTIKSSITLIEREAEVVIGYNKEGQIKEKRKIKYIEDSSICEELLPTESGFFFGGTDYDEWYAHDIDETIEILERVLTETDFEKEIVFYHSSW